MIVLGALACTPDKDYHSAFTDYVGIVTQGLPEIRYEDDGPLSIPVGYGNRPTSDKAYTVSYKVTGGTYGADYTVEGSNNGIGAVTVPAGQSGKQTIGYIKIVPISDLDIESDVKIKISLESADGASVGYPYKASLDLTLGNDDCVYKADTWVGGFTAVEKVTGKTDVTYDVIVTPDAGIPNKYNMTNFNNKKLAGSFTLDPGTRLATFLTPVSGSGNSYTFNPGTYVQCINKVSVVVTSTPTAGGTATTINLTLTKK